MRILFTGASSFTGYWFVRELVAAGHGVLAACRGDGRYEGLRAERVRMVRELCETRFGCAFGNDNFLGLTKTSFDVLCHHGAEVGDYRSPDFDPYRAAAANLYRLPEGLAGVAGPRLRAPDADRQRLRGERGGGLGAAARLQPLRALQEPDRGGRPILCRARGFHRREVCDPEPVRSLRGAAFYRLPDDDVAQRRNRPRADPALCPRQHPGEPACQGLCRFCRR